MARRRSFQTAACAVALAFAASATPLLASDGPPMPQAMSYAPSAEARGRWVDECSERLTANGGGDRYDHYSRRERREERARERDRALETCERYYDDYYEYYSGHRQAYQPVPQPGYYQPRRMQQAGCDPSPDCRRNCGEVVEEYEYVDVPVRAAPRPRPTKRIRTVPDKRIHLK